MEIDEAFTSQPVSEAPDSMASKEESITFTPRPSFSATASTSWMS